MSFNDASPYDQARVPQHSIEAETSVLGGLLMDNEAWDQVVDLLDSADFYRAENRLVFSALSSMINSNRSADVITVFEHLQKNGDDDAVGGLVYLNSLAQYTPSAANMRRYAEIVRERSILRKLAKVGGEINTNSFAADGRGVQEILDEAEQKVMAIGVESGRTQEGFVHLEQIVVRVLDRIAELADDPGKGMGLLSGFVDLDRMTSGFQPGDLVIIGGRPGSGKTSLAINIAENVALDQGLPVAVFSMEMGADQLGIRMIGSIGRIDQTHLRTGQLTDEEWSRLTEAIERLRLVNLEIDDRGAQTVADIRSGARRLARKHGQLGLIVVDYIQLMSISAAMSDENRATAVGEITRGLKSLAKEMKCPVIALSQLSRKVEERADKRPMMSDLRDSGSIEADADTILFIYRDDYYNPLSKDPGIGEVIVGKQRSGPTGTVRLAFIKAITKFESLSSGF